MQQQAGRRAAFSPERQTFAKRQHIGRQTRRQLGHHAIEAAALKPDLDGGERVERSFGGDDDKLRDLEAKAGEAQAIELAGLIARAAVLHPEDGAPDWPP